LAEYTPPEMSAPADVMGLMGEPGGFGGSHVPSPVGYVDPFQGVPVKDSTAMGGATSKSIPEMNALREWEDKHERELEEAARKEEAQKKERRSSAGEKLKKWHEERAVGIQQKQGTNRKEEESAEQVKAAAMKPGANPWERVVALIDTSARTDDQSRDTARMRNLLIQLKSQPVTGRNEFKGEF